MLFAIERSVCLRIKRFYKRKTIQNNEEFGEFDKSGAGSSQPYPKMCSTSSYPNYIHTLETGIGVAKDSDQSIRR
jgi:hypothetical protein